MRTPTPYRNKDGTTSWKVRYRYDGRQTSYTFYSQPEALDFARDLHELGVARAIRRVEERTTRANSPTLDKLFNEFQQWKTPRVKSDRTIRDYQREYDNWIRPHLGRRAVIDITESDVQRWVDGMVSGKIRREGTTTIASAKSVIERHALLHQILKYASAPTRRIIPANPAAGTELPKKRRKQPKGLNGNEWAAFYNALRTIDPDAADVADFLLASGWRWSEAIALTTFDVEDWGDRMWVTMAHVGRRDAHNRVAIVEDGKAEGSQRRIGLDQDIAQVIRRRVMAQTPGGLVFTTRTGRQWHYSNFRDRAWNPAVKAANLGRRPTPHWLRHTAVLWGSMSGANLAELSSRIGHRSTAFTFDVYGQAVTDVQPEALEKAAAMRRHGRPQLGGTT